nr:polysaccharide deacetylase family protein [uncultured Desulfobacter sp.]
MKYSKVIKNLLQSAGLLKLGANFRNGKNLTILRYHSIVEPEKNYYCQPNIGLPPKVFEDHVRYFTKNFNIISLDEVKWCLDNHKKFPDRAVVFTFDDGYQDNYYAYKILKKYNATGTFYIATQCIGSQEPLWLFEVIYLLTHTNVSDVVLETQDQKLQLPLSSPDAKQKATRIVTALIKSNDLALREDIRKQLRYQTTDVNDFYEKASKVMLSWDQVKEMSDNGMTIGGHTTTHLNLPNASPEDALREIETCKAQISQVTGKPTHHFSYPNGGQYDYYNDEVIEMVKRAGFHTATTSNNGTVNISSNLFTLKRIRVTKALSEIMYQVCFE